MNSPIAATALVAIFATALAAPQGAAPQGAPSALASNCTAAANELVGQAISAERRGAFAIAMTGFKEAVERGCPAAMFYLGLMYGVGNGTPRDDVQALSWFRRAAALGYLPAIVTMGAMARDGAMHDYAEAMRWFRKAADLNVPVAMAAIGELYRRGLGVPVDLNEAVRWYRKAADLGFGPAMYALGMSYMCGIGVKGDIDQAREWFELAVSHHYTTAQPPLDALNRPSGNGLDFLRFCGTGMFTVRAPSPGAAGSVNAVPYSAPPQSSPPTASEPQAFHPILTRDMSTAKFARVCTSRGYFSPIPGGASSSSLTVSNEDARCDIIVGDANGHLSAVPINARSFQLFSISRTAVHGQVSVENKAGGDGTTVSYAPSPGFVGSDSFQIKLKPDDVTLDVNVNVVAPPDGK